MSGLYLKQFRQRGNSTLLNNALQADKFLKERYIHIEEYDALLQFAAGDARKALNLLDLIASTFEPEIENTITNAVVVKVAQQNIARYDKSGEQHYDLVSAFIKSIRGSDPDAALYWMARMLKGGEDPVFIARDVDCSLRRHWEFESKCAFACR